MESSRIYTLLNIVSVIVALILSEQLLQNRSQHHVSKPPRLDLKSELAQFFAAFQAADVAGALGLSDASTLAPLLSRIPPAPRATMATPHLIIDIGANIGDTTAHLMSFFTVAECLAYRTAFQTMSGGQVFPCDARAATVLSYEPLPANYAALLARGAHAHWPASIWTAFPIAVTSPSRVPASGMVDFYSTGAMGDQQGSLAPGAAYTAHKVSVKTTTLDAHLATLGFETMPILLLKIDTEGFDAEVLLGAVAILARQQVRIITFEYNSKWTEAPGTSLEASVKGLSAASYNCYYVTPDNLIPLFGAWWYDGYEIWNWSNVVCFRRCDQVVQRRILAFYNKLSIDSAIILNCTAAACTDCAT